MVPNVSLGELLDLSQYGLSVSSVDGGQYPMFKMNNFANGFMSNNGVDTVNLESGEFSKYKLEYGDILFNRTNSIDLVGKTGIFTLEGNYVFASYLVRLKVNKEIADPFFLNYFMNFDWTKLRLRALATKAVSQANINPTQLKKLLKVPLFPLPEQRKIAKILSTWDKAITTTEKLIETSKQQKKALMQQLLTGKKRLINPETGKAFEGEWEEVKLSQIAHITMGSSPKSESYNENGKGLPLLQGNADIKSRKSAPRIYTSQITKECKIDDILLSVRAPVGSVAKSLHNACIGRGIAAIQAKRNVAQEFLYQWLLAFEPKWERFSQGSTFEAVNSNDIKTLHFSAPRYLEQQKIASVLTAADKEIEILEAKLAHFKQEKKALMQQLLTGKKRVTLNEVA